MLPPSHGALLKHMDPFHVVGGYMRGNVSPNPCQYGWAEIENAGGLVPNFGLTPVETSQLLDKIISGCKSTRSICKACKSGRNM